MPWVARDTRIKSCAGFSKCVPMGGATKTQIVYNRWLDFHTVLPYPKLIIRNIWR
jgi:hypothetical protein